MSEKPKRNLWRDTLSSVQFLSRLPAYRLMSEPGDMDFSRSAYTFPLAGLVIAVPAVAALWICVSLGLSAVLASLIAIIVQVVVTGALHEDGLADVADGFWGGATRARKLDIMRDSSVGTYGVLALIITVALRVLLLTSLIAQLPIETALLFYVAAESLSRFAILSPWTALSPARPAAADVEEGQTDAKPASGLSARYGQPAVSDFLRAVLMALPAIAALLFGAGAWAAICSLAGGALLVGLVVHLADRHISGHTGDVLGATQQVALWGLYLGLLVAI